jgi:hypothetical protein
LSHLALGEGDGLALGDGLGLQSKQGHTHKLIKVMSCFQDDVEAPVAIAATSVSAEDDAGEVLQPACGKQPTPEFNLPHTSARVMVMGMLQQRHQCINSPG